MGMFLSYNMKKCILVTKSYMSNCVEAQILPTKDARVVVKFLKKLFSWFHTPKAIINDRGTHYAQFEKILKKYGLELIHYITHWPDQMHVIICELK